MSDNIPTLVEKIKETIAECEKKIVECEKIISELKKNLEEDTEESTGFSHDEFLDHQEELRYSIENQEIKILNYRFNIGARTVTLGHAMIAEFSI